MASLRSQENSEKQKKCDLCNYSSGKYVCPKCGLFYCSLLCYKSVRHSECSEKFYENNVREFLETDGNAVENPGKMVEILKKIQQDDCNAIEEENLDSDDDEECTDLAKRMENVDLDDSEKVWENLTEDERKEFVAFLQSKEVSDLIPKWQPWWKFQKKNSTNKIQVVDEKIDTKIPEFPSLQILENLNNLIHKKPQGNVKYNLINILAGYLFTTRYFNGEYMDFPKEAASCLGTISKSLSSHENFENFEISVRNLEEKCVNTDWIYMDAENLKILREDLEIILENNAETTTENFHVKSALCDLHRILTKSLEKDRTGQKEIFGSHFPEIEQHSREKLKNYLKRVEYFMSYVKQDYFEYC